MLKKKSVRLIIVAVLLVTVSCSAKPKEEDTVKKDSSSEMTQNHDDEAWKEKVYQAIHQSAYKPDGKDLLEEMDTDDFYNLIVGEGLPEKRNDDRIKGNEYYVMGADFTNLRERIPGSYKRYFHYLLYDSGAKKEYLGAYYINLDSQQIFFEDLRGDIIDFETGKDVTNIDYDADPLTKYPEKKITQENAPQEVLRILSYLKVIEDESNYTATVEKPTFAKGEEPDWWSDEIKVKEAYERHFAVTVHPKSNANQVAGYYILRDDGRQLQEYSKRLEAYHMIYGTRISSFVNDGDAADLSGTIDINQLPQIAVAIISGVMEDDAKGIPTHPQLRPFKNPKSEISYTPQGETPWNTAFLISANDGTQIELKEVLGWSEKTESLMIGKTIFKGTFDRGEYLRINHTEAETLPNMSASITSKDGHQQVGYDFGYDGEGSHTHNDITRWLRIYGENDQLYLMEFEWIDYLTNLALSKK